MTSSPKPHRISARRINAILALVISSSTLISAQRPSANIEQSNSAQATRSPIPEETLVRIVRAEDERRWDESDLGALLADENAAVRTRALLAAGRIGDDKAIPRISTLLRADLDQNVRAMAAFSLGEIESGSGATALVDTLRLSKSPIIRARALESIGKIAAALPEYEVVRKRQLGETILESLAAEHKLRTPNRLVALLGITAALRARPANAATTVSLYLSSTDPRVRADAANALARLRAKEALPQLREILTSDTDPVARANAARVLGAAEDAAALETMIAKATGDPDPRVRVSATRSLAMLKNPLAADPLFTRASELASAYKASKAKYSIPAELNELFELATTLGRLRSNSGNERLLDLLKRLRETGAPEVEIALARIAPMQYVRDVMLDSNRGKHPWQAVSAFAQGLGELATLTKAPGGDSYVGLRADAQTAIREILNDRSTAALAVPDLLRALAAYRAPDLASTIRQRLDHEDILVRAAAADIISEMAPDAENSRALVASLPRALRDDLNDAALSILGALEKQQRPEATEAIKSALEVTDHLVRRRAAELLRTSGGTSSRIEKVTSRNQEADYKRAIARIGKSVRAVVSTDKGSFTIELLPDDAPLNVDNFVELAEKNFFSNITFHRVVPNFVIQGGDPRGDGNGGPGYQIRCEINAAPYERGAVGMALSGKDTGGSQWFVTHSPQPHLDGGYTVFGRVAEGMDVVDNIARGDRIRSITITEGKLLPAASSTTGKTRK